jgi:hypothetical protein
MSSKSAYFVKCMGREALGIFNALRKQNAALPENMRDTESKLLEAARQLSDVDDDIDRHQLIQELEDEELMSGYSEGENSWQPS